MSDSRTEWLLKERMRLRAALEAEKVYWYGKSVRDRTPDARDVSKRHLDLIEQALEVKK